MVFVGVVPNRGLDWILEFEVLTGGRELVVEQSR